MKHCNCDTEINRDGSGQLQRYLKALDPVYAPIDGRNTEDLLVFAKKYAAQIRFYDIPESKPYDNTPVTKISWREFFRRDMAVIAASIAVTDVAAFKKEYDEVNERLQVTTTADVYGALYAPIIGMMAKIDRWYSVAIPENPLYADIKLAIDSDLKAQAQKIIEYEEGFKFVDPSGDLKIDWSGIENKEVWGLNETLPPDAGIYTGSTPQQKILSASLFTEDIFHAFYNFLNKLVDNSEKYIQFAMEQYPAHQPHMALFITFLQLFNKAQQQMNGLTGRLLDFYYKEVLHLETKPSVPDKAHIVFELAKDVAEYPLITGTELKAGPDSSGVAQVYATMGDLVINQAKVKELKTIFVEKTPKATANASALVNTIFARPVAKSADGFGEKFDSTDTNWPTFGTGNPAITDAINTCEKIELIKAAAKRNDQAKIGFAIASPQLLMQGGKRLIEIQLDASAATLLAKQEQMTSPKNLFEIWFTGDKEWFKVDKVMAVTDLELFLKFLPAGIFNPVTNDLEAFYYVVKETNSLFVYLPAGAPSVIAYNAKLHTAFTYGTAQPVMQLMITPQLDLVAEDYKKFSAVNLSLNIKVGSMLPDEEAQIKYLEDLVKNNKITIAERRAFADFQMDGLTKLVLQNESQGVLPLGKPFDPFTAYPDTGKIFYIGSDEVFNKPLGKLSVTIKKTSDAGNSKLAGGQQVGSTAIDFEVDILENRQWIELSTVKGIKFSQLTLRENILHEPIPQQGNQPASSSPHIHNRKKILPVTEWKMESEKGFIRLTNLVVVDNANFLENSQNLAHLLEIKEVVVSYESSLLRLEIGIDEFYHVYPFGNTETYISTPEQIKEFGGFNSINGLNLTRLRSYLRDSAFAQQDAQKDYLLVNANNILLPQFTYLSPYKQYNTVSMQNAVKQGDIIIKQPTTTSSGDAIAERLILSASGLTDKIGGGANQYSADEQEEGMLFIGIENAVPLQMVSMLFQFAEGSAADEDNDPPEIHWSYLTNNEWRPMKEESIVSDGTYGFQTTGIVKIEIPQDATKNNTIISTGLYWICASVTENSTRIPMLIDVVTQAVLASFEDNNNDQSHFDKALPAGSISKLSVAVAAVAKVSQPFASFDGKHKEIGKEFYTRVSERLRHKARAITPWDYEHLVLDRFPSVYKVKCIPHTDPNCLCTSKTVTTNPDSTTLIKYNTDGNFETAEEAKMKAMLGEAKTFKVAITAFDPKGNLALVTSMGKKVSDAFIASGFPAANITVAVVGNGAEQTIQITLSGIATVQENCCGPQVSPGHVLLVPISNLKNRNAVNPLQPKTSRRVLLDIEAYIKQRTSPFVHVHAKNPVYEQVLVFFRVKFRPGYDKGFYMKTLNDEIVHYLTPWAFDEIAEVKFGQKIYASSIINFIEERKYVDFITDFLMVICSKGCCDDVVDTTNNSEDGEDILNTITGCCDMEILLQDESDFIGDIVAKPSTARSLLVSAPHHIIIPYQEPDVLSPCQKRKLNIITTNAEIKNSVDAIVANPDLNTGIRVAPASILSGAIKTTPKNVVTKKAAVTKTAKKNIEPPKKK